MSTTGEQGGSKYFIDGQEARGFEAADTELFMFAGNLGLVEMAELYGVDELPDSIPDRLKALQDIATDHWDFRKGAERQQVEWDDAQVDVEGSTPWNVIFSAADKLGLVQDTEPSITPQSLIILGGANRAPLDRMRYGLENIGDFGQLVYLGASRPVSDAEREKAADYAPDATTEFDLGVGALKTLLRARKVDEIDIEREGELWGMHLYEFKHEDTPKLGLMLNTPRMIGERRANTYDNYRFFADRAELIDDPEHSAVAVTTGFYTAGQHLPGVQELTLPYDTELETIGHSAAYSGATRKASQLLMETKAAIDAAVRLSDRLKAVEARS